MPYRVAWPLIQSGTYRRKTGSIEDFCGSLAQEGGPKFTIAQIEEDHRRRLGRQAIKCAQSSQMILRREAGALRPLKTGHVTSTALAAEGHFLVYFA